MKKKRYNLKINYELLKDEPIKEVEVIDLTPEIKILSSRYDIKEYIDFLLYDNHNYLKNLKNSDIFDDRYIKTNEEYTYKGGEMYENYKRWCNDRNYIIRPLKTFFKELILNDFERIKRPDAKYYRKKYNYVSIFKNHIEKN